MLKTLNRVLSIALIVTVVGLGAFWLWLRANNTQPRIPRAVNTEESSTTHQNAETLKTSQNQRMTEMLKTVYTSEELAAPEIQKLLQVLESPAYEAFIETNPTRIEDYFDFFQSQGVAVDKNEILALFKEKESASAEDAARLELHMRTELSARLRENYIEIGTDAGSDTFQHVITEFLSNEKNVTWMMTHFQGDFMKFGEWAADVIRNPIPPAEVAPATVVTDSVPLPIQRETSANTEFSEHIIEPPSKASRDAVPELPDDAIRESDTDIDTALIELFTPELSEQLKLFPEADAETALRARFSHQRFSTALQTLKQYGLEEGLRRLKESDPEIAKQIQGSLSNQNK